jgi:hypothetical protein
MKNDHVMFSFYSSSSVNKCKEMRGIKMSECTHRPAYRSQHKESRARTSLQQE